jgi:hypothetical protein
MRSSGSRSIASTSSLAPTRKCPCPGPSWTRILSRRSCGACRPCAAKRVSTWPSTEFSASRSLRGTRSARGCRTFGMRSGGISKAGPSGSRRGTLRAVETPRVTSEADLDTYMRLTRKTRNPLLAHFARTGRPRGTLDDRKCACGLQDVSETAVPHRTDRAFHRTAS